MSRIEKIKRLRHPGVLNDFAWPDGLPTFGRFNLVYGWNGSGKTTLSRMFRCLEQRIAPQEGQVQLQVDGVSIDGSGFPGSTLPVRVFNRDFINESVFPTGGGDVPPILVVGKENVERQKEANRIKGQLTAKRASLDEARATQQRAERGLEKHCADRAKVIKDTLRVPGAGKYNEYDKRAYRQRAQQMALAGDIASYRLSESDRDTLLLQHRSSIKPKIAELSYLFPLLAQLREAVATVLATTVMTQVIESLRGDAILSEWVRQGLVLHKDRKVDTCLFCEHPLRTGRIDALEAHFSTEYERFLERIRVQIAQLKQHSTEAEALRLPDRAGLYDDLGREYDSASRALKDVLASVSDFVADLVRALEDKRTQPFTRIELEVDVPDVEPSALDSFNEIIRRHNRACDDFQLRIDEASDRLALDLIAQSRDEFAGLATASSSATEAIVSLERDVNQLFSNLGQLEREIVEHRQPAEELNEDLRKYLGHNDIHLEVKDTGYQLFRRERRAESLSEGEQTALAVLYFLKTLTDRRFDRLSGIVVLDDPVSSLDANALYLAFGFIKQRTKNASQLFVLTHNFAFFRQVRNWFHYLPGQGKKDACQRPAQFYMLDRVHGSNPRRTSLCALDPLLERYESEYHYLFACVYRAVNATGQTKLEESYGLPNVARRLLESFLAFRRPQIAGELWKKLEDVPFDEAKKIRILRFLHTHSHGDTVGEPEHDPSLLGETRSVLADLLELIESEDDRHFSAMVGLVSPPADVEYPA